MIGGRVVQQEARVSIDFVQADGAEGAVEFIIDIGYSGMLSLSIERIAQLQLTRTRSVTIQLADDQIIDVELYSGWVRWDAGVVPVEVLAAGSRPLLGTGMLDGHELRIVSTGRGSVSIRPARPRRQRRSRAPSP